MQYNEECRGLFFNLLTSVRGCSCSSALIFRYLALLGPCLFLIRTKLFGLQK